MKKYTVTLVIAGALIVVLALTAIILFSTPSFNQCTQEYATNGDSNKLKEHISALRWCVGEFIEAYEGSIVAFGTLIIAVFTIVLSIATVKLWSSTAELARLTRNSINLAREEFVSSHRPRLRVRLVNAFLTEGHPVRIQYYVVNIGNTNARIISNDTEIHIERVDGKKLSDAKGINEPRAVLAGQALLFARDMDNIIYRGDWDLKGIMDGKVRISGFVRYEDANGTVRETTFWRIFRGDTKRFRPLTPADPDYEREYED